ncbi:hypothetical protein [Streptomyces sp. NBC_01363]|uniref:hypothetical protein n=1 Tax=Streptomyces sp. NBC_01363 TaxID=2903840 RepID=UPI0022594EA7|nr:hypothetical protein [Streptomyces sp. NBC_01363]MCX4735943.1 hypothetical protein [Streptomyces sp. NBC_01363]
MTSGDRPWAFGEIEGAREIVDRAAGHPERGEQQQRGQRIDLDVQAVTGRIAVAQRRPAAHGRVAVR